MHSTVKDALRKLFRKGVVFSAERSYACNAGGAIYVLHKWAVKDLGEATAEESDQAAEGGSDQAAEGTFVCLSLNKQTNQTKEPWDFKTWLSRLDLDQGQLRMAPSELQLAFERRGGDLEKFLMSLEHAVFHARSPAGKGLTSPKSWILSKIATKFFAEPLDFVSWQQQQDEAEVIAMENRVRKIQEMKRRKFAAGYSLFREELSDESAWDILSRAPQRPSSLISPAAVVFLKKHYAEISGQQEAFEESLQDRGTSA